MIRAALRLVALGGMSASLGGCLVLKSQHDELAVEVTKLRKQVAQQDAKTGETIEKADALTQELDAKLKGLYQLDPMKNHTVPANDVKLVMTVTGNVRGKVLQNGGAPTDASLRSMSSRSRTVTNPSVSPYSS